VDAIREETIYMLFHIKVESKVEQREVKDVHANVDADGNPVVSNGPQRRQSAQTANANAGEAKMPVHVEKIPGRNDSCPCGSGKKYKNCCGKN
ncbi:MAG: SEC-C metal-binding domain-containing protein, partial [Christensenellaceae bacterium]